MSNSVTLWTIACQVPLSMGFSGPITSWQVEGEKAEAQTDFIFLGSQITADGDCSHEIKTLVPRKKSCGKPGQCDQQQRR